MTVRNGKFECNNCGKDLDNGGLDKCVVISAIDWTTGLVANDHLCLDRKLAEDGEVIEVSGCSQDILYSKINLGEGPKKKSSSKRTARDRG